MLTSTFMHNDERESEIPKTRLIALGVAIGLGVAAYLGACAPKTPTDDGFSDMELPSTALNQQPPPVQFTDGRTT